MTHSTNQSPIFLQPGELYFGQAPCLIATLLGACVAIALWHPRRYIGGVCHDVLRSRRQAASAQADERYGDVAFALLLAQIDAHVARPSEFQAKPFGGGAMYATPEAMPTIGHDNILQGRRLLRLAGIPRVSEHVGGSGRRKLTFDLATGQVWLAFPVGRGAHRRRAHG